MTSAASVVWVLEKDAFPQSHNELKEAVLATGHGYLEWRDEWLESENPPAIEGRKAVFHGSLANADALRRWAGWSPGAFCDTPKFNCSSWYSQARLRLVNQLWCMTTVSDFVANPRNYFEAMGADSVFVRPDGPLKEFSGRVVTETTLSLQALDYGYYYEDTALPIVIAPARRIGREWRFVIVSGMVVAGSEYHGNGRLAIRATPHLEAWQYARTAAIELEAPEAVYVMDICERDEDLCLLELNPFSGADLYACDAAAVVRAVSLALQ